jgi:hypothetical protein
MARGWTGVAALIALSLAGTAGAQDSSNLPQAERYRLRVQYREYRPSLTGTAQKGNADNEGSVVDVTDDLAIADERTFDVRGAIQFKPGWKLRGSYMPFDYKGDTEVKSSFSYGQTRYLRFEHVVSTMKGAYYGGDLEWDFLKGTHGFLGAVVGARVFDVDAALVNVSVNSREVDTLTAPLPVIGVATRLYTGRLSVEGELAGLSVGSHGSTLEAEGSVRIHISDRLAAMGGYRYLSLDGKDNLDQIKVKLSGWQFGLELSL